MQSICVFCGSNLGERALYAEAARLLGETAARRNLRIVYGGARVGLMGALADSALSNGGQVLGVLPQFLMDKELGHRGLTKLCIVESMHERKAQMAAWADAFVALPGGFGTFEEIFEMLTWTQLGVHHKPCGLLNIDGYFEPLRSQLDRAVDEGFLHANHREMVIVEDRVEPLLNRLLSWRPVAVHKWLDQVGT